MPPLVLKWLCFVTDTTVLIWETDNQLGRACSSPVQLGLHRPIPTQEKISPTLLKMPPNSWPNEAFSLTSKARAFLFRGTQYPLSPWPGSEISQVMGGTVDTRSSLLPLTQHIRLRDRKRERCWLGMWWLRVTEEWLSFSWVGWMQLQHLIVFANKVNKYVSWQTWWLWH